MTADQLIAARRQTDGSLVVDLSQTAVAAESNAPLLSIKGLSVRFGGIVALDNVSFDVKAGQICGLIGPNGAGKTTLFNCLSRLYPAGTGTIDFAGERLLQRPRHRVARLGISRTFQNLALFQTMSVRDNVLIGSHCRGRSGFVANALRLPIVGREERLLSERATGLLEMLELRAVADVSVSALPFWTRKRVELARALASEPKLLLLDETGGRAPPCGPRRTRPADSQHPRPARHHHSAGRTSHESGVAHLRSGGGTRPRAQDCRGDARRSAKES
jgi:branched-chain amino acid transport system ATP-binding protein